MILFVKGLTLLGGSASLSPKGRPCRSTLSLKAVLCSLFRREELRAGALSICCRFPVDRWVCVGALSLA